MLSQITVLTEFDVPLDNIYLDAIAEVLKIISIVL